MGARYVSFSSLYLTQLNRNKNQESEPTRRNLRKDVETTSRHRARSVSTGRRQAGRQSPDILFQSTPLYLPKKENVKTIEISINKREQTKQMNRKPAQKKNAKQVSRKKLSCEGMMTTRREEAGDESGEEEGEEGEDLRIPSGNLRRRDKGAPQCQYPR